MARRACVEAGATSLTRRAALAALQSSYQIRRLLLRPDLGEKRELQNWPLCGRPEALVLLTSTLDAPPLHRTATCLPTLSALNPSPVNHSP